MADAGRHNPRIGAMESVTAMLVVLFQLFFGWCGDRTPPEAPAEQRDTSAQR